MPFLRLCVEGHFSLQHHNRGIANIDKFFQLFCWLTCREHAAAGNSFDSTGKPLGSYCCPQWLLLSGQKREADCFHNGGGKCIATKGGEGTGEQEEEQVQEEVYDCRIVPALDLFGMAAAIGPPLIYPLAASFVVSALLLWK